MNHYTAAMEHQTTEQMNARIRRLRKQKGLTLMALAKQLDVSWQTVQNWESQGKRARPNNNELLTKLARALGVSEAYILMGQEELPSSDLKVRPGTDVLLKLIIRGEQAGLPEEYMESVARGFEVIIQCLAGARIRQETMTAKTDQTTLVDQIRQMQSAALDSKNKKSHHT